MNWKKLAIVGALAIGAAGFMTGCGGDKKAAAPAPAPDKNGKPAKIVAGMDDTFAPMGFRNDKGELVGFDIDMAKAISKEIGVPIEFKAIDWASKESELESGRIDCIWNGFTMTDERKKVLAFTKPYMDNVQGYVVLNDSAVKTPEDLKGKRLSIQESSTAEIALNRDENLKKSFGEIKAYPDFSI